MIKLVVGIDDLDEFLAHNQATVFDYDGQSANAIWTRYKPKRADEILNGGSIYRVIKRKIQCRQKIIGFEMVETAQKGTQCMIIVEPDIIQVYSTPKRPFQGWRYLQAKDVPKDRGIYKGGNQREEIPRDMEEELIEMGLI